MVPYVYRGGALPETLATKFAKLGKRGVDPAAPLPEPGPDVPLPEPAIAPGALDWPFLRVKFISVTDLLGTAGLAPPPTDSAGGLAPAVGRVEQVISELARVSYNSDATVCCLNKIRRNAKEKANAAAISHCKCSVFNSNILFTIKRANTASKAATKG